jgi:hypothetical protein
MSTPQELLFGQPINPIENAFTSFENIWSTATGQLFGTNGANGLPDGAADPVSSINYLMNKRSIIERSAYQRPLFRLADKNMKVIAELTLETAAEFEELMADSGTARYTIDASNWLVNYIVNLTTVEEDLHLLIDPFPSNPSWRNRWGGKIHTINVKRNADGTNTVELLAVSNREHAKRLLFAANPFFAPEIQLLRMWILPGPLRSILFVSCFINLARLFVPGLSFITNVFDPLSWINPLSGGVDTLFNVNPLNWPIQVAFVNPITDESRWSVLGATWTTWHDTTLDLLKDAGVMMRAYTWLQEDIDSPYDELIDVVDAAGVVVDDLIQSLLGSNPGLATSLQQDVESVVRPTRNCVIFSFEDKSGQTGPTGTALDGLLNLIGVTLDDLISSTLINAQTGLTLDGEPVFDLQGNEFPIAESLLGVAPAVPKVIWREGSFNTIGQMTGFMGQLEATHILNKSSPNVVMTGGKSPPIVNQLQTFGIKYALSQLGDLINPLFGSASWVAVNTAFQFTPSVGLDSIYQGQFDNILFAWERVTNPLLSLWGGDLNFQEYFERGSSTAWTLSSIVTLQTALWKNRAYQGFKGTVLNGYPWVVDIDTRLGDRNGFEFYGVIYVDQIYGIRRSLDRHSSLVTNLTIGEDKDKADPLARTIRAVQGVYTLFSAFLGEGTIFQ